MSEVKKKLSSKQISELEVLHEYSIDVESRTIYVSSDYDHEGDEPGVNHILCNTFIKNLDYLNKSSDPITVKLMTVGGDWNYGMAMYDAIAQSKCDIHTISYAHARSMSSIIIQAAKKRTISKHADFMLHYGTYSDDGDFREVFHTMEHYAKSNEIMLNIYANRCIHGEFFVKQGLDLYEVKNFIKERIDKRTGWWMTADEALEYGFVDAII